MRFEPTISRVFLHRGVLYRCATTAFPFNMTVPRSPLRPFLFFKRNLLISWFTTTRDHQQPSKFPFLLVEHLTIRLLVKSTSKITKYSLGVVFANVSSWWSSNPLPHFFQADGLVFVAGQIGLIPGSMVLAEGPEDQARLGLRHLARVLEVFGCSTSDIVQVGRLMFSGRFYGTLDSL